MEVDQRLILGQSFFMLGLVCGPPELYIGGSIFLLSAITLLCTLKYPRGVIDVLALNVGHLKKRIVFLAIPTIYMVIVLQIAVNMNKVYLIKLYIFLFFSHEAMCFYEANSHVLLNCMIYIICILTVMPLPNQIDLLFAYFVFQVMYLVLKNFTQGFEHFQNRLINQLQEQWPHLWDHLKNMFFSQFQEQRQRRNPHFWAQGLPLNHERQNVQQNRSYQENASPSNNSSNRCAAALTEILTCPICLERLRPPVITCVNGHAICKSCLRPQVRACPNCARRFSTVKTNTAINQVIEEISHYD